jgi:hypothetical protein
MNKLDDMIELMRDGYGLDIDSFRAFTDAVLSVNREGGAETIRDCAKAFATVITKTGNIIATMRELAEQEGLLDSFNGYKASDYLKIEFKFMDSEDLAGFHFHVEPIATENLIVDAVVSSVTKAYLGEFKVNKI